MPGETQMQPRWPSLSALALLVPILFVGGCGSFVAPLEVRQTSAKFNQYHPPKPAPVVPANPVVQIVTPAVSARWNAQIEAGNRAPYALSCMSQQDAITQEQWRARATEAMKVMTSVIDYYQEVGE